MFTLLMTLDISSHLSGKDAYSQEMYIKVVAISPSALNTQNALRLN